MLITLIYFLAIILITPLIRSLFFKINLVDKPQYLKNHTKNIPKGLGIIIVLSLLIFINYFFSNNFKIIDKVYVPKLWFLNISLILFLIVSLVDDFKEVNKYFRLIFQIIVVYLSLSCIPTEFYINGNNLFGYFIPGKILTLLIVFYWLFIINETNFTDGIDGHLAIRFFFLNSFFLIVCLRDSLQILGSLSIICILLSIYIFTFNHLTRFKFFLGESGSIPLGYFIGWQTFIFFYLGYYLEVLLMHSLYQLDVFTTHLFKIYNNEDITIRHRSFLFLQIYDRIKSTFKVNILYIFLSLINLTFACLVIFDYFKISILVILYFFYLISFFLLKKIFFKFL